MQRGPASTSQSGWARGERGRCQGTVVSTSCEAWGPRWGLALLKCLSESRSQSQVTVSELACWGWGGVGLSWHSAPGPWVRDKAGSALPGLPRVTGCWTSLSVKVLPLLALERCGSGAVGRRSRAQKHAG